MCVQTIQKQKQRKENDMKKTFGVPYMGGKNATAENIVSMFPRGRRLLDLFGGGASVTHAALVSGRFEQVIYNDVDPLIVDMLNRLITEPLAPLRFVDRVEFKERYKVDPMVFFCWKYPSSRIEYSFSSGTEKLHELIFKLHEEREKPGLGEYRFQMALADPQSWAADALEKAGIYNFTPDDIKHAEGKILSHSGKIRELLNTSLKEHGKTVAYCISITNAAASRWFQKSQQQVPDMKALKALEHGDAITVSEDLLDEIDKYKDAVKELRYMKDCRQAYKADWADVIQLNKPKSIYRRLEAVADCLKQNADRITISNGEYNTVEVLPGDVIYLDPPYQNTSGYISGGSDYNALTDWIKGHADTPIYISEMADAPWLIKAGFSKIWTKGYIANLANNKKDKGEYKPRVEALWCNEAGRAASPGEFGQPMLSGVDWFGDDAGM